MSTEVSLLKNLTEGTRVLWYKLYEVSRIHFEYDGGQTSSKNIDLFAALT